jgi:hypothetical protein
MDRGNLQRGDRRLTQLEMSAMMRRHAAAMHILKTQSTSSRERALLLAEIVWPSTRLRELEAEEAAA